MGKKSRKKKEKREQLINKKESQLKTASILLEVIRWGTYLILFTPLVVSSRLFFPFIAPKGLYFMGLVEVIFASWLVLIVLSPNYRPRFNLLTGALSLFLFSLTISTIFSVDPSRSFFSNYERMAGLLVYLHLFAFFLVISSVFRKRGDWTKILTISLIAAFLVSVIGLLAQIVGEKKMPISVAWHGSTLGNSSFLGSYLLFNLFFAIYLFFEKEGRTRPFLGTLMIVVALAFYTSRARAASLASVLGFVLILVLYLVFKKENKKLKILGRLVFFSLIILILSFVVILEIPGSIFQKILISHSNQARPLIWQMALSGLKERPIFGWGPETFELIFDKYFHPCFFLKECGGEIWFDRAHNLIFDTLATTGIFGLFAFLFLFSSAFYILFKNLSQRKNFWQASIIFSLLVAYFLQGLTVFDAPSSLIMLFLVFGFIGASPYQLPEKKEFPKRKKIGIFKICFVFLVFFFFFLSFQKFVFQPAKSAHYMISSLLAPTPQKRIIFYQKTFRTTSLGKYQLRAHLGDFVLKLASKKKASENEIEYITKELEKTIKESPKDFRSRLVLGKLYLIWALEFDKEKIAQAKEVLEKGIETSPKNQQGYWVLSQVEVLRGDCQKALALAEKSLELEPRVRKSSLLLERVQETCQKKSK
jgi:O-antigen ligase